MSRTCYYMTVAEKDAYLLADATRALVSGPHDSQAECVAICSDDTGTGTSIPDADLPADFTCCPGITLPQNVTISIQPDLCDANAFTMTWNQTQQRYEATITMGSAIDVEVYLVCQEGRWYLSGATTSQAALDSSCEPFSQSFSGVDISGSGCGSAIVVITE